MPFIAEPPCCLTSRLNVIGCSETALMPWKIMVIPSSALSGKD